jgi:hypothetical protein
MLSGFFILQKGTTVIAVATGGHADYEEQRTLAAANRSRT